MKKSIYAQFTYVTYKYISPLIRARQIEFEGRGTARLKSARLFGFFSCFFTLMYVSLAPCNGVPLFVKERKGMDTRTLGLQILVDHEVFMCVPQPHGCSLRAFIVTSEGFIFLFYVCFNCFPLNRYNSERLYSVCVVFTASAHARTRKLRAGVPRATSCGKGCLTCSVQSYPRKVE